MPAAMSVMVSYISESLRRLVTTRACGICEYCLIHEDDTFFGCEIDHIISLKHGGETVESNLAYACLACNRHKGTDIGSVLADRAGFGFKLNKPRLTPIIR